MRPFVFWIFILHLTKFTLTRLMALPDSFGSPWLPEHKMSCSCLDMKGKYLQGGLICLSEPVSTMCVCVFELDDGECELHTELLLNVIICIVFHFYGKSHIQCFISHLCFSTMRHEIDFLFPLTCPLLTFFLPKVWNAWTKKKKKKVYSVKYFKPL